MAAPDFQALEEPKDLGFGSVVGGANEKRLLNRDGSFNSRRLGLPFFSSLSLYHNLITISWPRFFGLIVTGYLGTNMLFALLYIAFGPDSLAGIAPSTVGGGFWRAFFFSVETLATIGYGNVSPNGLGPHFVMTLESLVGLMSFALVTGILFARFSRPTAAVMFSSKAVVAPYRGITAFMFRTTNARSNQLVELEAKVLFSYIDGSARKYYQLTLERTRVVFFPLSWTIVHPIDEKSPMWGMTHEEFTRREAEFMILVTGIDETFSQSVHARSSYKAEEIHFGHRFVNIYNPTDDEGTVSIDVRKLSDIEVAESDWAMTSTWHHTGHFAGFAPPRKSESKRH